MRGWSGALVWRLPHPHQQWCLRAWPNELQQWERLDWIHRTLREIERAGFSRLPVPLATRSRDTCVRWRGRFWELTPWMAGKADYHRRARERRLRAAVAALADFHLAARRTMTFEQVGPSPAVQRRAAMLDQLRRGQLDRLTKAVTQHQANEPPPSLARLGAQILTLFQRLADRVETLVRRAQDISLPLLPCHGDLWHDHVLFMDDQVSAFIDFGNLRIDAPETDLGRLLGSLVEDDQQGWQVGLQVYSGRHGLGEPQIRLLHAIDRSTVVLSGVNWLRWIYLEDRVFAWPQVQERLNVILRRMESLVGQRDDPVWQ